MMYLSLGSNLGDRRENLQRALALLAPEIVVEKISPLYETAPMYNAEQPPFLNLVCAARPGLAAVDVLARTKAIEEKMGKHEHNMPRVIDIDILLCGDEVVDTPELIVPHPKMAERAFVLVPLNDIVPEVVHPVLGVPISTLLKQLGDTGAAFRV